MNGRHTPPPIHVHVPETTPVHVHMRRSPGRGSQEVQVRRKGGGSKGRAPWIPPGKSFLRRDPHSGQKGVQFGDGPDGPTVSEDPDDFDQNLTILLQEQESARQTGSVEHGQTNALLRALVEAEIDGVAVASQLKDLKETVDSLRKEKNPSKGHAASLERQRRTLMEKIQMFHHTNRSLRELLRGRTEHQRAALAWSEENEALRRQLTEREADNMRLSVRLSTREQEVGALTQHLDLEKDSGKTSEELTRLLESTQERLESQLSRTDSEKVRLAAQIQVMQQRFQQQQQELHRLQEELQSLRREEEQENVLTSISRQEAEESARQLRIKLQEKEASVFADLLPAYRSAVMKDPSVLLQAQLAREVQLSQARSQCSDWRLRHSREASVREQLQTDISSLRPQVTELSQKLQQDHGLQQADQEEIRRLTAEIFRYKNDNKRLEDQVSLSQETLKSLRTEAGELRSIVRRNQHLLDKYKKKVQQVRLQSEELCLQLEQTQQGALQEEHRLQKEKEQLRRDLSARLRDLEALPDKLRRTEEQLRDAQQEAEIHRRRTEEHGGSLSEVRHKVEQQGAQLEASLRRSSLLQEDKNLLKEKTEDMQRKLDDLTLQNKRLSESLAERDVLVLSVQQQMEEKTLEADVLSRQLQQALDDAHRQVDESVQRILSKEKMSQVKALELQGQLSRARTELSQVQRSKDETERRLQNQLQNMKERLEQSDCTNRSLSNYVHFLKTSCGPLVTPT